MGPHANGTSRAATPVHGDLMRDCQLKSRASYRLVRRAARGSVDSPSPHRTCEMFQLRPSLVSHILPEVRQAPAQPLA